MNGWRRPRASSALSNAEPHRGKDVMRLCPLKSNCRTNITKSGTKGRLWKDIELRESRLLGPEKLVASVEKIVTGDHAQSPLSGGHSGSRPSRLLHALFGNRPAAWIPGWWTPRAVLTAASEESYVENGCIDLACGVKWSKGGLAK